MFYCSFFLKGLIAGCTQWIIWTHGMARRWWVHHSSKYVLPFKNFLIATPILSLNMLAQSCSPFFFFSLSLCPVVGARVQEACCCATPSIITQYG